MIDINRRYLAVIKDNDVSLFITEEEFSTFIAHFGRFGNIEIHDHLKNEVVLRTKGVYIDCFYPEIRDRSFALMKAQKYYSYFHDYRYQLKRKYPKGRLKTLYKFMERSIRKI